ncbi:MAG: hypothetical protein RL030_367 [Pseudomonadota bacterium]|jgi:hypothetical protein
MNTRERWAAGTWPLLCSLLLLALATQAQAVPFWGAKESSPLGTPPAALKPGEFVWAPGIAPAGPVVIIVSLDEQRAYVFRNGVQIGYTTVSSGKPGHDTPRGVFTILQKDRNHRSSTYNNAPMPNQERLTWDGVALHAGGLPGYPESHGCVHLPSQFSEELFLVTQLGTTVVVVDERTAPTEVVHPAMLAPVGATAGEAQAQARLASGERWRWEPEKALEGPVSILVGSAEQRLVVLRNGIEIGRTRIELAEPGAQLGTHVLIVSEGMGNGESPLLHGAAARNWVHVALPGYAGTEAGTTGPLAGGRVHVPQDFARLLYPLLAPGTTLFITDATVLEQDRGTPLTILGQGNPN